MTGDPVHPPYEIERPQGVLDAERVDLPAPGPAPESGEPLASPTGPEAPAAGGSKPEPLRTGFAGYVRIIAALTFISRLAGLVRESIAFKAFGTAPVWSAFNVAFVIPNTFRRLFGEGALTAAFIPEYTALLKADKAAADRLASLTMGVLIAGAGLLVVLGEVALWLVLDAMGPEAPGRDAVVFTMVMLPYMPLVCATAVLGGILQTNGRFVAPGAAPILFNGCMIAANLWAWRAGVPLRTGAMAVSISVTLSGVVQLLWCLWGLRGVVQWTRAVSRVKDSFARMMKRFVPVTIAMGSLQLGIIADQIIAGYPVTFGPTLPWGAAYPVSAGGNAVLSYASRLYQFPLGVFGIAVATAVFPALARAWGNKPGFTETMRHGVRLSLFIGVPATVGLIVVGRNLCAVVFSSEAGKAGEVVRVAQVLMGYSMAVWAYSLTHVFTRAFYASGDTKLPMKVSLGTIGANVVLNLVLIWPLAEAGLAWATAITATAQCLLLGRLASRRLGPDEGRLFNAETMRGVSMILLGSVMMGAVLIGAQLVWPLADDARWLDRALALARDTMIGVGVFSAFAVLTKREELKWLLERNAGGAGAADFG